MSLYKKAAFVLVVFLSASLSAQAVELLKIMPLGDSNTRGPEPKPFAGPNPAAIGAGGYRYPLQQMLTSGGYRFDFVGSQTSNAVGQQGANPPTTWTYDPTFQRNHQGLAGFTNAGLITGGPVPTEPGDPINDAPPLVTCLSTYQPKIVLLMSGTNGNIVNVAGNLQSLDQVIQTIATNSPTTQIIVSTVFDRWDSVPAHDATQSYNAGIPSLVTAARQQGELVSFVDCGSVLSNADFYWSNGNFDGVHPDPVVAMPKVAAVWYNGIERVAPVPEPGTALLLLLGAASLLCRKQLCRHLRLPHSE